MSSGEAKQQVESLASCPLGIILCTAKGTSEQLLKGASRSYRQRNTSIHITQHPPSLWPPPAVVVITAI